jgi:flagellar hook-associated protein 1 FlgK
VDGKTWPTISLDPLDTSASMVAQDLNNQFKTLGIGAQAAVSSNGALVLSTTNAGSNGSIAILNGTANPTLGLTQTTPTYQNGANATALRLANLANASSSGLITGLTGSALNSGVTLTATTNALNLQIDGKTWPTITLSTADTNATAVATDLNNQFATLGIGAKASVDGSGALVLSTTNTGSNGSIAILSGSANAALGLTQTIPIYQNGLDGKTFTAFFGSIASAVGTALANAQAGQTAQQDVVTQTHSLRQQISGVDLNTEAATLLQLQSSYQAASKIVSVVNSLASTVLNLIGNPVG